MPEDYVTQKQFNTFAAFTTGQFAELRQEVREFRTAVSEQYDWQKKEYDRQIGVLMENNAYWAKFVVEAFRMDIERIDRKFGMNDEEHQKFDRRVSRVEAATS